MTIEIATNRQVPPILPSKPERPEITWRGSVPASDAFDDVYYSSEDGESESKYIFLEGAHILENAASKENFVIGETGFGTGLNFLTTWQAWRKANTGGRLTFISAEAFPMRAEEIKKALDAFPSLRSLSEQLISAWPPAAAGFHSHSFDGGNVSLILMFGDAREMFEQLSAKIDAWYLDGFAPAKNPDLWTNALFKRIASLSSPRATIATFTSAGFVRRGLQAQGFEVEKSPGFGEKRERLTGIFKNSLSHNTSGQAKLPARKSNSNRWAVIQSAKTDTVAIVGDGIAGASVAYSLARRGITPVLVSPQSDPRKASSLPVAIIAPQLMLEDTLEKWFFYAAFAHAVNHPAYQQAFGQVRGTKYVPTSPKEIQKFEEILRQFEWGPDWMQPYKNGLVLPRGGTVDPQNIHSALTRNIDHIEGSVERLEKCSSGWHLCGPSGETIIEASTVVLATGAKTTEILTASGLYGGSQDAQHPSIRLRAGQLECLTASAVQSAGEHTTTFGGFISAAISTEHGEAIRTVGSTFDKLSSLPTRQIQPSESARQINLDQCSNHTGAKFDTDTVYKSWIGIRATTPDHMPYAGPIPDWDDLSKVCAPLALDRKRSILRAPKMENGLYCLTGLGSKGFQFAPLLGSYIAAMICDDPSPIPNNLHAKLHPARGFVKAIIRRGSSV